MNLTRNTLRMLEASTGHIRTETAQALGLFDDCGKCEGIRQSELWQLLAYMPWHQYGWIFWVPTEDDTYTSLMETGFDDLCALLRFAQIQGFEYLKLDADAPDLPAEAGFPVYDW